MEKPQLSLKERLTFTFAIVKTLTAVVYASISWPFRKDALAFKTDLLCTAVRNFSGSTTIRHSHALGPSTEDAYLEFVKKKNLSGQTITLEDGTKAHCLGLRRDVKNVLVWFHGGGYVLWANPGHFELLYKNVYAHSQFETAVVVLEYDVAPYKRYPRQLQQAVNLLRHLMSEYEISPSKITLGGDSAGGNLALGVLSHLSHPDPSTGAPPLDIKSPFRSAVLVAPWVSFSQTSASMTRNASRDCLSKPALSAWSVAFLGESEPGKYSEPILAPAEWWEGLRVGEVLVTAGEAEVFLDDIVAFVEKFKAAHPSTKFVIGENEVHDAPIIETMLGLKVGVQTAAIRDFLSVSASEA